MRELARARQRSKHEDLVDGLDEIHLAIKGAVRLALDAETADEPTLVVIEVAAVLGFIAEALDRLVRELDPARSK